MDGSAQRNNLHRTLASQPAAAVELGAQVTATPTALDKLDAEPASVAGAGRRSRLQRMLLMARQMQQH